MNRGLFGTLVMLSIIALIVFMASCESKSGQMAHTSVKFVLVKKTADVGIVKQFKVKKLNDNSIYFWSTRMPYEVNDTVSINLNELQK